MTQLTINIELPNYRMLFRKMPTNEALEESKEYCRNLTITTKAHYNTIRSVFCPVLNTYVIFNSIGFHHLSYKPDGTARDISERIFKLQLFPLAVPVIKNSVGIDEDREVEVAVGRKSKRKIKKGIISSIVAMVGQNNPVPVRVLILKFIGGKEHIFYSIMKD